MSQGIILVYIAVQYQPILMRLKFVIVTSVVGKICMVLWHLIQCGIIFLRANVSQLIQEEITHMLKLKPRVVEKNSSSTKDDVTRYNFSCNLQCNCSLFVNQVILNPQKFFQGGGGESRG